MVRINLVPPKCLADQHLIAEYNEILMLLGYVRKYPEPISVPDVYTLGKGHIKFFKNKLLYLKERHETIKFEMEKRGFRVNKTINLAEFPKQLCSLWKPQQKDIEKIRKRLVHKLRKKPNYYRYYRVKKPVSFFEHLLNI